MSEPKSVPEHANVLVFPPALFAGAVLLSLIADFLLGGHLPMPLFARTLLGLLLIAPGVAAIIMCRNVFRAAHTPVPPFLPTTAIVRTGLYKFSRNPIYIAMVLIYLGAIIILGSGFGFLLLLPVLAVLHFGIVLREQAYLMARFGEDYKNYCASTPRWLQ